jgi:hypothetical protein
MNKRKFKFRVTKSIFSHLTTLKVAGGDAETVKVMGSSPE